MVVRYRFFFFKQKTAYEMRSSDWSSDVCSSDLAVEHHGTPLMLQQALRGGGLLDDGAVRREVAAQHRHGAVPVDRRRHGADHILRPARRRGIDILEIGSASCRARVCQYV